MKILYNYKIYVFFFLLSTVSSLYSQNMLQDRLTVIEKNVSVFEILSKIESTTSYKFVYDTKLINAERKMSLKSENETIAQTLQKILAGTNSTFKQVNNTIIISPAPPQTKPAPQPKFEPAFIGGVVRDNKSHQPIPGATLLIVGTNTGTSTDANGNYQIKIDRVGTYQLSCSFIGYDTYVQTVTAKDGETVISDFELAESVTSLNEVVVYAKSQLDNERANLLERKNSIVSQDAISNDVIVKSGSITTTQALQRVTGLSISSDGKYAAIRGMSDRDMVAQLNGARLSSANSDRNAVPLDLVPAQLLDAITVSKTVTPDRPGDATAGIVELKTRSIPDSLVVSLSLQTGYNDAVGAGGKMNSFEGAELGFFGQKVKAHRLSSDFLSLMDQYGRSQDRSRYDYEFQTLVQMREVMQNARTNPTFLREAQRIDALQKSISPVLTTAQREAPVNQIYSLAIGNSYKLFGRELGIVLGANYYNRYESYSNAENNRFSLYRGNQSGTYLPGIPDPSIDVVTPNRQRLLSNLILKENTGVQTISYGGLGALTYRISDKNEVSAHYIGTLGAEATATDLIGSYSANSKNGSDIPFQSYLLRTTGRSFHTLQFRGKHKVIVGQQKQLIDIDWNISGSKARQEDPDYRSVTLLTDSIYLGSPDRPVYYFGANSGRFHRDLIEDNKNYTLDIALPFNIKAKSFSLKTGIYYLSRSRDYFERSLAIESPNDSEIIPGYDLSSTNGNLNTSYGPGAVGLGCYNTNTIEGEPPNVGWLYYAGKTENNYNDAKQMVTAYYAMLTGEISSFIKLIGGVRFENTNMNATIDTTGVQGLYLKYGDVKIPPPGGSGDSIAVGMTSRRYNQLFKTDYKTGMEPLPSATIIANVTPLMQVRASYSKTLGRPELGEIIPSNQYNPIQLAFTRGNNRLVNQYVQNFDLRWEWFKKPEEIISATIFYKRIDGKLEKIFSRESVDQYSGKPPYTTVIKVENNENVGIVRGIEFEFRKALGFISPSLNNLSFNFNALLAQSQVEFTGIQDSITKKVDRYSDTRYRPLFEQPNYVVNFNLLYQNRKGTNISMFYNITGERLVEVQIDGTPNIYEEPFPVLDLTFSQRFGKGFVINGFVKNILNSEYQSRYTKPGENGKWGTFNETYVRRSYDRGREFSLGLSYTF